MTVRPEPWTVEKTTKRRGPHAMTGRVLNWSFCARCGLIALKNDASRVALKRDCEWLEGAGK